MRALLFGTGEYYHRYKWCFSRVEIVALLDNDVRKQGTRLDDLPIMAPSAALGEPYDGIYLLSIHAAAMRRQLLDLGVSPAKIFDCDEIYDSLQGFLPKFTLSADHSPRQRQGNALRIAVLAQDMEFYGATVVLCQAVQILAQYWEVTVVAMRDGPLRESFLQAGAKVAVDPLLLIAPLDEIPWVPQYDLLFINTNLFYGLFRRNHLRLPMIWWLHEPEMLYQGKFCEKIAGKYSDNIHVYAVGTLAAEPFQKRCPQWPMAGMLRFGVEDFFLHHSRRRNEKMIFAVVGTIDPIKGQDVFIEAIMQLPDEMRAQCEFWLIGGTAGDFAAEVLRQAAEIPGMKVFGVLDREQMKEIYQTMDVLVCPSREESMSAVTVEAMMHFHPCIVSERTGVAEFVSERENGLIFPAEDAAALADKMRWMFERRDHLNEMGLRARGTYERYFSCEAFAEELLRVVKRLGRNGDA